MPVERRGQAIVIGRGSTGNGRNPMFNGRRQPSCGGTSRMTRECQVRICEGLGVQFPGPTRPKCRCRSPFAGRTGRVPLNELSFLKIGPAEVSVMSNEQPCYHRFTCTSNQPTLFYRRCCSATSGGHL